jgi:hypothetical protein
MLGQNGLLTGPVGIGNIPDALTVNTTVYPTMNYKGKDATAAIWNAWNYGDNLAIATRGAGVNPPTLNTGFPLHGQHDDSVQFNFTGTNNGKYYLGTSTSIGNLGTDDAVFELIVKTPSALSLNSIAGKVVYAVAGWYIYTLATGAFVLNLRTAAGNTLITSAAPVAASTWYHLMCFVDRSGYGQWYTNGVLSGSALDISAKVGVSLDNVGTLTMGYEGNAVAKCTHGVALCKLWQGPNLLDTHLKGALALAHYNLFTGSTMRRSLFH